MTAINYLDETWSPITGCSRFGVWGCAGDNEIWVHGAIVDGKIILEPTSVGHEFWHIIENNNPGVWNPDIWMEGK